MLPISQIYGTDEQLYQRIMNNIGFGIHVSLPCIVQSYDSDTQTVEAQPSIRERVIEPNGAITFRDYPLLINVPVVFPRTSEYQIYMPIRNGDECLVVFSDLAIDNWWLHGNVQNPIEQRRHDLSDGFAIFGVINQAKLHPEDEDEEPYKPDPNKLSMVNLVHGTGVTFGVSDGALQAWVARTIKTPEGEKTVYSLESVGFTQLIKLLRPD